MSSTDDRKQSADHDETKSDPPTEPGKTDAPSAGLQEGRPEPAAGPAQAAPDAATAEARVAELEGQLADLTDRLLRAHAEMDNIRKRTEREKADTAKYAVTRFAQDMLAVADNLQRAIVAVPSDQGEMPAALKALLDGVVLTEQELQRSLERHNVRRIAARGEAFNPHLHQAVMEQEDMSVPAGTVLKVFQDGYTIEERLLRPAMVVVARGGARPAKTPEPPAATPPEGAPPEGDPGAARPDGEPGAGEGS